MCSRSSSSPSACPRSRARAGSRRWRRCGRARRARRGATSSSTPVGGDVAADQDRLGAEGAQLLRGVLGRLSGAEVADRDAAAAEGGEVERDRLPDPREPPVTRTDAPWKVVMTASAAARRPARSSAAPPSRSASATPCRPARPWRRRSRGHSEHPRFLLAVAAHGMVGREVGDQLAHARAELEREVRRRRPDEGVDVADRGSAIAPKCYLQSLRVRSSARSWAFCFRRTPPAASGCACAGSTPSAARPSACGSAARPPCAPASPPPHRTALRRPRDAGDAK